MAIKKVDAKVDFIANEHEILSYWEKNDIFGKLRKLNSGKKPWSFIDGPITANNPMGVHHAWGRTLKDIYNHKTVPLITEKVTDGWRLIGGYDDFVKYIRQQEDEESNTLNS